MAGPEYTDVEKPFIDQRVGQGWELRIPRQRDRPFRFIVTNPGLFPGIRGYDAGIFGHDPGISPSSLE